MSPKRSPLAPHKLKKIETIEGINVSITHCGLKKNNKDDLVLIKLDSPGKIQGFFTKSITPGEPIIWNKSIINHGKVSAILINSGNANVFNGEKGKFTIQKIVKKLSDKLNIPKNEIFIASTGVIGEKLDEKKIIKKIPYLISNLSNDKESWLSAAKAIMTTDTYPKTHSEMLINKEKIIINGIAKGSGMIFPNMGTMLAFIFTNYDLNIKNVRSRIQAIIDRTFNSITVDGDTSTSDMVLLFSVNNSMNQNFLKNVKLEKFLNSLENLMSKLSEYIVKDGEGASKFIKIKVSGAICLKDAKNIGQSIANSPLFKTAMAGSDANWGRIVMGIGKSNAEIDPKKVSIKFGNYYILKKNLKFIHKDLDKIDNYLKEKEIDVFIDLGLGSHFWDIWTCDFTKEYISINTDYRS